MENTQNILSRLITEKDRKENLHLDMETFSEIPGQKIIVRNHHGNDIWYYHNHSFFEINYVYRGGCVNLVEDEPVLMKDGDFIMMNPGTYHIPYSDADGRLLNFIIDPEWLVSHFGENVRDNKAIGEFLENRDSENYYRYVLFRKTNPEISKIASKIINISETESKQKYLLLEASMIEFLCYAFYGNNTIRLSSQKGKNSATGRKLVNYLNSNFKNVTLEMAAEYFGYSKTHICRIFKEKVGKSFGEVLTEIRMQRAKYGLLNTNKSIKTIAEETGFDSSEYFQRLFKRETGVPPGQYRKKYR